MKKCFSNIRTLAALLMAGAFAACSSDDNSIEQPANPTASKTYTLTVNASKSDASTRALALDGTKLLAKWAEGDELSVFKAENRTGCTAGNLLGTISPVAGSISADGAKATFKGNLSGTVSNGDKLMLVYHSAAFAITGFEGQAGTLASASNLDCATALVTTASVSGSDITISEASATFTTHTAMLKLTLTTDGTTTINPTELKMTMTSGTTPLYEFTFTPTADTYTANGNGVLYFALPSAADVAAGLSTTTDVLNGVTITYTATVGSDTYTATKTGYTFAAGKYYAGTLTMAKLTDLSTISGTEYTVQDGEVLTGTLASNVKISIAAPVAPATTTTVTLKDADINGSGTLSGDYAGITCEGNATIILEGTNKVKGFDMSRSGISVPSGNTLTIQGSGSLAATGGGSAAGIGGGGGSCGNIVINGGNITATGGDNGAGIGSGGFGTCGAITISGGTITATGGGSYSGGAGIGSGYYGNCGNITISGGTVTATGGASAAGIGGGYRGTCGAITITSGVTSVTATKGSGAPNSIGAGSSGTCGTVTIGGTEYASGISQSPYEYPTALSLTNPAVGEVIGSDGNNYAAASVPSGVTKVAMIAYVSGTHGLAIALADEGYMDWTTAKSACEAHTPAFTGGTWKLPSQDEWKTMFSANGGDDSSYSGLNNALAAAGGNSSKLQDEYEEYWSSSEFDEDGVWYVTLDGEGYTDWKSYIKDHDFHVRACLVF